MKSKEHKKAISLVSRERHRQVFYGYDSAHDDDHSNGEIITHPWGARENLYMASAYEFNNPKAYKARLVKTAGLIVAEIERLIRKEEG